MGQDVHRLVQRRRKAEDSRVKKAKRDFVTCTWDVKYSVAHRPKIGGEVKTKERKEPKKWGPNSTVLIRPEGTTVRRPQGRRQIDQMASMRWEPCEGTRLEEFKRLCVLGGRRALLVLWRGSVCT